MLETEPRALSMLAKHSTIQVTSPALGLGFIPSSGTMRSPGPGPRVLGFPLILISTRGQRARNTQVACASQHTWSGRLLLALATSVFFISFFWDRSLNGNEITRTEWETRECFVLTQHHPSLPRSWVPQNYNPQTNHQSSSQRRW